MREIIIEKYDAPSLILENFPDSYEYQWHNKNGDLHRNNGLPSYMYHRIDTKEETLKWHKNGKLHRLYDLPARIKVETEWKYDWSATDIDESFMPVKRLKKKIIIKEWFQNGAPFRVGGKPHYVSSDGTKKWLNADKQPHRMGGGPAIINGNGKLEWLHNGRHYRGGDKPCIIWPEGKIEFCGKDGFHTYVNSAQAMLHYGEQIEKDRKKNGVVW